MLSSAGGSRQDERVDIIIEWVWIALWTPIVILALRDLVDSSIDRKLARQGQNKLEILQTERFVDLTSALVLMAIGSLLLGILAVVTPHITVRILGPFRTASALLLIALGIAVLAFKCLAVQRRWRILRHVDQTFWRWLLVAAMGSSARQELGIVPARRRRQNKR